MTVPVEYGGPGFGEARQHPPVEPARLGLHRQSPTSMLANTLALTPIKARRHEQQKKKYLGMLAAEPLFAAYATTEPGAGSDVAGIKTRFEKHGDEYVLTEQKPGSPTRASPASS